MKKFREFIVSALLFSILFLGLQPAVLAEERPYTETSVTQTDAENPNTGIVESVGVGLALLLAGGGSVAGTVLLRKTHKDHHKNNRQN